MAAQSFFFLRLGAARKKKRGIAFRKELGEGILLLLFHVYYLYCYSAQGLQTGISVPLN